MNWAVFGILASLAWGTYIILLKKATSEQYYGLASLTTFFVMSLGILFVSTIGFLLEGSGAFFEQGMGIAFASGLLWGTGMCSVTFAVSSEKTLVSKLTPLYNTNTLVAVLLGIFLLNEVPEQQVVVLAGAILVVLGGILVIRESSEENSAKVASIPLAKRAILKRLFSAGNWITWGIIASVAWGLYVILLKIATSPEYYAISSFSAFFAMSLGIICASLGIFTIARGKIKTSSKIKLKAVAFALSSGIVWGIGMFSVIYAFSKLGASVAPMVPLYNTNTLVAVLLGMWLLKEKPKRKWSTISGAVLIVIGAVLVTM